MSHNSHKVQPSRCPAYHFHRVQQPNGKTRINAIGLCVTW